MAVVCAAVVLGAGFGELARLGDTQRYGDCLGINSDIVANFSVLVVMACACS